MQRSFWNRPTILSILIKKRLSSFNASLCRYCSIHHKSHGHRFERVWIGATILSYNHIFLLSFYHQPLSHSGCGYEAVRLNCCIFLRQSYLSPYSNMWNMSAECLNALYPQDGRHFVELWLKCKSYFLPLVK